MVAAREVDRINVRRERASELLAEDVSMGQIAARRLEDFQISQILAREWKRPEQGNHSSGAEYG
jgi:hypothetical protein